MSETVNQNDIDRVMMMDPLQLSKSPEELKLLIRYQRQARAQYENGVKPKKTASSGEAKELLAQLDLKPKMNFLRR